MRSRERVVDEMLVLAAQAGQVDAFARLVALWQPRLLRHAWWLTRDREGMRETVQDAWMAIVRGLPRLRDPACFGSWALCIVGRRSADWIRRRQQTRQRSAQLDDASMPAAPNTAPGNERVRLQEAIRCLESGSRLLLVMFYLENLTVAEIARVLGIPAGTVKSRLYHAREQLRAVLEV